MLYSIALSTSDGEVKKKAFDQVASGLSPFPRVFFFFFLHYFVPVYSYSHCICLTLLSRM